MRARFRGDGRVKFCTKRFCGNVLDVAAGASAIQATLSAADPDVLMPGEHA
jgi:hypothetical protein